MAGYQALYRQWRPLRFADVVGQEHVTRSLRHAVTQDRVAHAYLFCGPRGTGKTSIARILAQALRCSRPIDGEPCGACEFCRQTGQELSLDVQEMDAASHRGIEDIRVLRDRLGYAASDGGRKVYIIDEVHMLTEPAFNALLKTLEEPPPSVYFVLATTDPRKVPSTIMSRCQRFDFQRHTVPQIESRLAEVAAAIGAEVQPAALTAVARRVDGGMRDALGLLDQCLIFAEGPLTADDVAAVVGTATAEELAGLADALERGDAPAVWQLTDTLYDQGRDLGQVVRDLTDVWRQRWQTSAGGDRRVLAVLEGLLTLEGELRRGASPRVAVEVALARLAWPGGPADHETLRPAQAPAVAHASAPAVAPANAATPQPTAPAAPRPQPSAPAASPRPQPTASVAAPAETPSGSVAKPHSAAPDQPKVPPSVEAPATPVSQEDIMARWPDLIAALRPRSVLVAAQLESAHPRIEVRGNVLTLIFENNVFIDLLKRSGHLHLVEQVLEELVHTHFNVSLVAADEARRSGDAAAPTAEPANADADAAATSDGGATLKASFEIPPDVANDPLVQETVKFFDGEIVAIEDTGDDPETSEEEGGTQS